MSMLLGSICASEQNTAADQLWDQNAGASVPAAQRCHQLHAGQRGLVRDWL